MPIPKELKHDERAWELRQKWVDLTNKAVEFDQQIETKSKTLSPNAKFFSLEELFKMADLTQTSRTYHTEKDNAWDVYFKYLIKSNQKLSEQD